MPTGLHGGGKLIVWMFLIVFVAAILVALAL